jgi:hypothetical protein
MLLMLTALLLYLPTRISVASARKEAKQRLRSLLETPSAGTDHHLIVQA